ncbi:uncharacterized protein BN781_01385 [Coprococcus sp. CAG:782]|jgi:hypothetical protein|uniref:hypothetical protein n=1 Tax=Coprococcus sp. OM04-5BH TaxID=2293093 RepID=UPI0003395762|nr:hypothetical protein [Coprococcus sp. OM04-5BH]MEE0034680.1 hypothetical protein [Coprococcus sp.]RHV31027.1 hypothetical protein DXB54_09710 [Coprococcus sp. OM04-5BH]CCY52981.1 uncharacterized protein BN781_01385 [Coprococcus sp. CAG:782]
MEDNHLLNKDYIKIKNMNIVSYGGNQTWLERKHLSNYGCGIVAMADLSIYLAEQNPNMMTDAIRKISKPKGCYNKNDYLAYVELFYKRYVHFTMPTGITGLGIQNVMNVYFMLHDIGLKATWKVFLSSTEMMKEIRHLIRKNKPVILSIGPNSPNVWGKEGVKFYLNKDGKMVQSVKNNVKSHYVVVTGVETIGRVEYLVVSSWGKKYYINYKEYREYIKKHGSSLTSSILYIKGLI